MVCSYLNMYLFELAVSRSMEFPVIEKANYYDYQPMILHIRGGIQGLLKLLKRLLWSSAGFVFRQGLDSGTACAKCALTARQKIRGHNTSGAVHHNYHLIKLK